MWAMTDVSEWFTKIPGSYFYIPAPAWISVLIYYAILFFALSGWLKTARRKFLGVGILILIFTIYFCRWAASLDETDLTVLPLNGGHAVFVDAAGRKNDWLIDCGDEYAVNFTLKNFLRAHGVNSIPRLALTEGRVRNYGGAKTLNELFGVNELWTSATRFRSSDYNKIVSVFQKANRRKILNCGERIGCWQMLWPSPTNDFPRADDNALVLLGNFSGTKILLLSDLSRMGQSGLLATTNDLRADIVVAGLPGGSEPLCDDLIDAIRPKIIVIADSEFPATRRANRNLKNRLAEKKIPTVYTSESGSAKIVVNSTGWRLKTMDGREIVGSGGKSHFKKDDDK